MNLVQQFDKYMFFKFHRSGVSQSVPLECHCFLTMNQGEILRKHL